jgi:hypothetical protein
LDALGCGRGAGTVHGDSLGGFRGADAGSQTLQKPLVEMTSLEVLAAEGSGWQTGKTFVWNFRQDMLCVLMDALRGDVYMAVWRFHKLTEKSRRGIPSGRSYHTFGHHFKLVHAPTLFPFERFLHFFQSCFQAQSLLFVGSAAARYKKELAKTFGSRAHFRPDVIGSEALLGGRPGLGEVFSARGQILSPSETPLSSSLLRGRSGVEVLFPLNRVGL